MRYAVRTILTLEFSFPVPETMAADSVSLDAEAGGNQVSWLVSIEFPEYVLTAVTETDSDEVLD